MANEKEKKSIHIGSVIKEELNRQGRTTVWLAEQLGCHRTNLYKIYDRRTIDTGVLLRISRIMGYDFFQRYSADLAGNVV
ncbi:MAG: XRE family transcriptional regulator [Prevotella sp.]|nr:XRE family transcriptional regulator [Prevotella sp.]